MRIQPSRRTIVKIYGALQGPRKIGGWWWLNPSTTGSHSNGPGMWTSSSEMIWTYVNIHRKLKTILGYHPPWYPAFRSSGASLSIFEFLYLHKIWTHHAESLSSIPWDFCLKEKPPKCPRRGGTLFFASMRAVIMGGTTPTHPTCEDVSSGVKKIKFLLGPWSSVGSSYWLKAYHFLCNKHQEVSIFNFC